jgi:hypothetical protein
MLQGKNAHRLQYWCALQGWRQSSNASVTQHVDAEVQTAQPSTASNHLCHRIAGRHCQAAVLKANLKTETTTTVNKRIREDCMLYVTCANEGTVMVLKITWGNYFKLLCLEIFSVSLKRVCYLKNYIVEIMRKDNVFKFYMTSGNFFINTFTIVDSSHPHELVTN